MYFDYVSRKLRVEYLWVYDTTSEVIDATYIRLCVIYTHEKENLHLKNQAVVTYKSLLVVHRAKIIIFMSSFLMSTDL
jgi:hypothetical protein